MSLSFSKSATKKHFSFDSFATAISSQLIFNQNILEKNLQVSDAEADSAFDRSFIAFLFLYFNSLFPLLLIKNTPILHWIFFFQKWKSITVI